MLIILRKRDRTVTHVAEPVHREVTGPAALLPAEQWPKCDTFEQGTALAPSDSGPGLRSAAFLLPWRLSFASHIRVPESGIMPSFVWVNVFGNKNETIVFAITYLSCRLSF